MLNLQDEIEMKRQPTQQLIKTTQQAPAKELMFYSSANNMFISLICLIFLPDGCSILNRNFVELQHDHVQLLKRNYSFVVDW
jgi:hypothetical protein